MEVLTLASPYFSVFLWCNKWHMLTECDRFWDEHQMSPSSSENKSTHLRWKGH